MVLGERNQTIAYEDEVTSAQEQALNRSTCGAIKTTICLSPHQFQYLARPQLTFLLMTSTTSALLHLILRRVKTKACHLKQSLLGRLSFFIHFDMVTFISHSVILLGCERGRIWIARKKCILFAGGTLSEKLMAQISSESKNLLISQNRRKEFHTNIVTCHNNIHISQSFH